MAQLLAAVELLLGSLLIQMNTAVTVAWKSPQPLVVSAQEDGLPPVRCMASSCWCCPRPLAGSLVRKSSSNLDAFSCISERLIAIVDKNSVLEYFSSCENVWRAFS